MQQTEIKTEDQGNESTGRRTFLNRIWAFFAVLACLEFSWFGVSIFNSRKKRQPSQEGDSIVIAGTMDTFKPNTVTAVPEGRFYLACLEDGSFLALSRICTHLGCSIPWDEEQQKFVCPCHGSSFNMLGEVLSPPAPRPLDTFPVRIENGIIKVNVSKSFKRDRFEDSQATRL